MIHRGGIIVYPTDTIYGLGCDPNDACAVDRLARLKQRPADKSMILLASRIELFDDFIDSSKLSDDFVWQRDVPTTWVMPANQHCPPWLKAHDDTIAVRLTDNRLIGHLCSLTDSALISTSANLAGRPPASNAVKLHQYFHGKVNAILIRDNNGSNITSQIRHYSTNQILRS